MIYGLECWEVRLGHREDGLDHITMVALAWK